MWSYMDADAHPIMLFIIMTPHSGLFAGIFILKNLLNLFPKIGCHFIYQPIARILVVSALQFSN